MVRKPNQDTPPSNLKLHILVAKNQDFTDTGFLQVKIGIHDLNIQSLSGLVDYTSHYSKL